MRCVETEDRTAEQFCSGTGDDAAVMVKGNLEAKLPTIWTDEKALQLGRSSDMEKMRRGEDAGARKGREVTKPPGPAKVQKKVYLWYIERKCPANGRKCFNLAQMAQTDQRYRNQWKSMGWIWFWHLQAISLLTHD